MPRADRHHHDLSRVLRPARCLADRQGRRSAATSCSRVHDLRAWARDVHRTVDDTPFGGGPGMVMKPEPWGEALDAVVPAGEPGPAGGADAVGQCRSPRHRRPSTRPSRGIWSSPAAATRASTPGSIDDARATDARRRGEHRRLCAGRRRAGGAGHDRGHLPAAARRPRQRASPRPTTRSAAAPAPMAGLVEGPVYTRPRVWRGPRGAAGAAVRRPRGHRAVAPGLRAAADRREPSGPCGPARRRLDHAPAAAGALGCWMPRPARCSSERWLSG